MNEEELVDKFEKHGVFVVYNKTLKLYQIMVNNLIFYLMPHDIESMSDEDAEVFLAKAVLYNMASKNFITFH